MTHEGRMQTPVWRLVFVLLVLCCNEPFAAEPVVTPTDVVTYSSEAEVQRTHACVMGSIPREFRFVVEGSPPLLAGDRLTLHMVDQFARSISSTRYQSFLKHAGQQAWDELQTEQATEWDANLVTLLVDNVFEVLVREGPMTLGVDFCGEAAIVGSTIRSVFEHYAHRAIVHPVEGEAAWSLSVPGPSSGIQVLILAAALHLAKPDAANELISYVSSEGGHGQM